MSSKKFFFVLTALFVLLSGLLIAGVVGGNMLLEKKSEELKTLKAENEAVELQQTALIQAKQDIERYAEIESIAKSVVPQDKDQAKTVREIVAIAAENGIPIKSVSFQNSTLGDKPAATSAPAATAGGSAGSATATPKAISQLEPVKGIQGVYTLEIQVSSAGEVSYQNFLSFLEGLEKNRRTAHVTGISLEPSDSGQQLNFNLTLNAYVRP